MDEEKILFQMYNIKGYSHYPAEATEKPQESVEEEKRLPLPLEN